MDFKSHHFQFQFHIKGTYKKEFHFLSVQFLDVPIGVKLHPCNKKNHHFMLLCEIQRYVGKVDQLNSRMIRLQFYGSIPS